MNKNLQAFLELSTYEKVVWYKEHFKCFVRTRKNGDYYDILLKDLMLRTYELPKYSKVVKKEEVSGFLLYMIDYYEKLIDSFDVDYCSWTSFFLGFMNNRYLNYKRGVELKKQKEELILNSHVKFEYRDIQEESPLEKIAEPCESYETEPLLKLHYIFSTSEIIRKRFFVFLVSCSPSLSDEMIERICTEFSIDLKETLKIITALTSPDERERLSARKNVLEDRRNYNYGQALLSCTREKHDINITRMRDRNEELCHIVTKVNQKKIANLLGLLRGTVSSNQTFIKHLINYCLDGSYIIPDKFLPTAVTENLRTGRWRYIANEKLTIFHPFRSFPNISK